MKKQLGLLFIIIITSLQLLAGGQTASDTIASTQALISQAKYKDAFVLIRQYAKTKLNDVNAAWLCGQTAYYAQEIGESQRFYEQAMQIQPDNLYIKLGYAKILVEIGKFDKAALLLHQYLKADPTNIEALTAQAKMHYWQGDYAIAQQDIKDILNLDSTNANALVMREAIKATTAPWTQLSTNFAKDNQPLMAISPMAEAGFYVNQYLKPSVSVQQNLFSQDTMRAQAWRFQLANHTLFTALKLSSTQKIGLLKRPHNQKMGLVGLFSIDKTLFKFVTLSAQIERKPCFFTMKVMDTTLMQNNVTFSASWNKPNSFMGSVAYNIGMVNDGNQLTTASAWAVSPALKLWIFELRAGYGFSASTSKIDRYAVTYEKLQDSVAITGSSSLYFTPINQQIHNAIGVVSIRPKHNISLTLSGSYGFLAKIDDRYLYAYYDANGNVVVDKGYTTSKYSPFEVAGQLSWQFNKRLSLSADYKYNTVNYYYKVHYAGLAIKFQFIN